jgi:mannose-6-phosphate isomerase
VGHEEPWSDRATTLAHEDRPWGGFDVLADEVDYKVKRIMVVPGRRLSYQVHARRSEHWFVVAGRALVTLDEVEHRLAPGQAIDVPVGTAHRIASVGDEPLLFVEVQFGDYFGEDDITRLDDDYGRSEEA